MLYPIIRRKRRPLVDLTAALVTVATETSEPEKVQGLSLVPVAPVTSVPPVVKAGRVRFSRENK